MWQGWPVDTSLVAARVRDALRSAGCQEWEPGRRGFQVEGDPQGGWVVVTCVPWVRRGSLGRIRELQKYREILVDEGLTVRDSPHVADVLRITLPG